MLKTIVTSLVTSVIAAILVVAGAQVGTTSTPVAPSTDNASLGSQIETLRATLGGGADIYSNTRDGGLILKSTRSTTTAATTEVIPASDIVGFSTISLTPLRPRLTLQLPASTTFPQSFLPKAGDRTQIVFFNATTTTTGTANTAGFAAGSGTLIKVASSTPASTASTTGQNALVIDVIRKPNTDLLFLISPFK